MNKFLKARFYHLKTAYIQQIFSFYFSVKPPRAFSPKISFSRLTKTSFYKTYLTIPLPYWQYLFIFSSLSNYSFAPKSGHFILPFIKRFNYKKSKTRMIDSFGIKANDNTNKKQSCIFISEMNVSARRFLCLYKKFT